MLNSYASTCSNTITVTRARRGAGPAGVNLTWGNVAMTWGWSTPMGATPDS